MIAHTIKDAIDKNIFGAINTVILVLMGIGILFVIGGCAIFFLLLQVFV